MVPSARLLRLPYGTGEAVCYVKPERRVTRLIPRPGPAPSGPAADIINRALANPIGSKTLAELAAGKKNVVVLTSDHTRPVPSCLTLPPMLEQIRRGSPGAKITVLIAAGCHRGSTPREMKAKFGPAFYEAENIINHDPQDGSNLVSLGRLPSGGELIINRLAAEADLLVADGFIEPHQFAGFSGGRKSVLPGIAALKTVLASHNAEFTVHPKARPGSLEGNPFQTDMIQAARTAKLAFILNVTLTADKQILEAVAGDMEQAHLAGCRLVLERCRVKAAPSPIVIASNGGYPLDQNVYQSTKSIMTADLTCAPNGVIIAVNECRDGCGSESFLKNFQKAPSLTALLEDIEKRGREETIEDQWVIQLTASILVRRRVIMVTGAPDQIIRDLRMTPAESLTGALSMAEELVSDPMAPITLLPDAVTVAVS
ncbi:MAG: nickel-dependent lactate racemase [Deltaproteobacteria bacterium]|jgi:nickel-dependent lactate racemase|nr:nickel-dependent lactate racemase [Deltaproteobacteria bacterium]